MYLVIRLWLFFFRHSLSYIFFFLNLEPDFDTVLLFPDNELDPRLGLGLRQCGCLCLALELLPLLLLQLVF